jgi:small subunit ribosomal protein S1
VTTTHLRPPSSASRICRAIAADQRPERFAVGDRVDALVTAVDRATRRISVSIKALEMKDEKEAVEQYGSQDSGRFAGRHPGCRSEGKGRQGLIQR